VLAPSAIPVPLMICFSCLRTRTDHELGDCRKCGTRTCGLGKCKGTCLCDLLGERDDIDDE
jgi:hypothetical protein